MLIPGLSHTAAAAAVCETYSLILFYQLVTFALAALPFFHYLQHLLKWVEDLVFSSF